jgi:hypothetical protein
VEYGGGRTGRKPRDLPNLPRLPSADRTAGGREDANYVDQAPQLRTCALSASGPGREPVLGTSLRLVLAGAGRARPVVVELDHARQFGEGDLPVAVRVGAME